MLDNSIPTNTGQLIGLADKMINGINTVGAGVPVVMLTAAQLQTALNAFVAQDGAFNGQRTTRKLASEGYQLAMSNIYDWLLASANVLATSFGTFWNTQWAQAGWTNASTAIPTRNADRLSLTLSLVNFFTAHSNYEVSQLNVEASYGQNLRDAALSQQASVTAATVALENIGTLWESTRAVLVGLMDELILNLKGKLAKDDTRWAVFGLEAPASITTPGQPVNVRAMAGEEGTILVQCDQVSLASRYRFRMRIFEVQQDYVLAASSKEPMGTITGVDAGQTAEIIVQAVNGSLQSVPSEPILFTVPVAAKAAAAKSEPKLEAPAANGNGHASNGNGHALTARA